MAYIALINSLMLNIYKWTMWYVRAHSFQTHHSTNKSNDCVIVWQEINAATHQQVKCFSQLTAKDFFSHLCLEMQFKHLWPCLNSLFPAPFLHHIFLSSLHLHYFLPSCRILILISILVPFLFTPLLIYLFAFFRHNSSPSFIPFFKKEN